MSKLIVRTAAIAALALITACSSSGPRGTEVTRYHLGKSIPAQSINIEAADASKAESLEFNSYLNAVSAELSAIGLSVTDAEETDLYAIVDVTRAIQQKAPKRSPFSVGIGGGSYGGSGGVGAGASFPMGGSKGGQVFVTTLDVKLIRRAEKAIAWEGNATRESETGEGSPTVIVQQMATVLFSGFPGESGKTVLVKDPDAESE